MMKTGVENGVTEKIKFRKQLIYLRKMNYKDRYKMWTNRRMKIKKISPEDALLKSADVSVTVWH